LVPSSGAPGAPITFADYGSGPLPVISGAGVVNAFHHNGKSFLWLRNLDFVGGTGACVNIFSHDILLDSCAIHGAGVEGVLAYGAGTTAYNLTVRHCSIYSNATQGLHLGSDTGIVGPTNCLIEDNVVYSNGANINSDHGVYVKNVSGCVVRGNTCYSNASGGIKSNEGLTSNVLIYGNRCYSNRSGLILTSPGCTIYNNLLYSNTPSAGIFILAEANGNFIYHNTLVNNADGGIRWLDGVAVSGNIFRDNLVLQDDAIVPNEPCYRLASATEILNNTFNNNLVFRVGGSASFIHVVGSVPALKTWAQWKAMPGSPDAAGVSADPVFVTNYTDLHLQTTSPCKNAGVDVGVTNDYDGRARPMGAAVDIGAYEFVE